MTDSRYTLHVGDVVDGLARIEDGTVQTCVTSPPYWGLRDYGEEGQIGLEDTPEAYVEKMVAVFREVRRVLRDDGCVFLNLGDSFQDKQLVGIPWRVAFALQADGWYLRSDIIWSKPNPMPESVTDRPTKAHEFVFLLSKSARYFWDGDRIREKHARLWDASNGGSISTGRMVKAGGAMGDMSSHPKGYPLPNPAGRNARSVWTIPSKPYKEAHFATMPPELAKRCVLAGSPKGGLVLDPFTGAGTTALVALEQGCRFVGCELNPEYAVLAERRVATALRQQTLF